LFFILIPSTSARVAQTTAVLQGSSALLVSLSILDDLASQALHQLYFRTR